MQYKAKYKPRVFGHFVCNTYLMEEVQTGGVKRLNPSVIEAIVESYRRGFGFRLIAKNYNVSPSTVRYHLVARGVKLRPNRRPRRENEG